MEFQTGTNWHVSVAEKVKALRVALKLTQDELGERAGYPENGRVYVSKIERGDNKVSTIKAREQLAKGFGLTPDDLSAFLEDRMSVEEALRCVGRKGDKVDAPATIPAVDDAQSAVEAALGQAFDAKVHTLRDLDAVRGSIRRIHKLEATEADFIEAARTWLDAAARLRRHGKTVDLEALLVAVTLGTKALPHQIERAEQRDEAVTAEAEAELRGLGGEPGQAAAMGERLKRLAKRSQGTDDE